MIVVPIEISKCGSVYESDGKVTFKCNCGVIRTVSENTRYRYSNVNKHLKECSANTEEMTFLEPSMVPFSSFSFLELAEYGCPFWKQEYIEPFCGSVTNLQSIICLCTGMIIGYVLAYV